MSNAILKPRDLIPLLIEKGGYKAGDTIIVMLNTRNEVINAMQVLTEETRPIYRALVENTAASFIPVFVQSGLGTSAEILKSKFATSLYKTGRLLGIECLDLAVITETDVASAKLLGQI